MTVQTLPPHANRLITVASGKGGVGKTWFSITLAHALAEAGRRVLLFDGDLGLANVDIQLGLMPEQDIADAVTGVSSLADAITPYCDRSGRAVFDVLAGKSGSGALQSLKAEQVMHVRHELIALAAHYDHVILDLAAGIDETVLSLAVHQGPILTVLSPDPTALTDAYAFIKLTHQRMPSADIRVVVNAVANRREGEKTFDALAKACENFLRFLPVSLGMIQRDERVRDAIRHQIPLLTRSPQSEAGQDVRSIAKRLIGRTANAA